MTSYLTLLLATLGIMIGLFTVTGFINRMGAMLLDIGAWNIVAMVLMAFVFGWLRGTGLPPTATYIVGAVIIVPPMVKLGINPWVAHFFVFFLSVWGELSPPTSLTAAVAARIANASFMRTMLEALKICLPITLMTFAIFTRSNMVTTTGWLAIADTLLVLASTLGIAFAMFGRTHHNRAVDIFLRCLLAAIAFVTMFHPDMSISALVAGVVTLALIGGVVRHIRLAPKTYDLKVPETGAMADAGLAPVLAEARRDIGRGGFLPAGRDPWVSRLASPTLDAICGGRAAGRRGPIHPSRCAVRGAGVDLSVKRGPARRGIGRRLY